MKDTQELLNRGEAFLLVKELAYKTLKFRYQYIAHIFPIEHIRINISGTFTKCVPGLLYECQLKKLCLFRQYFKIPKFQPTKILIFI